MEKEIFAIKENTLSYGRGYVYSLQYHLVWCTKYRKKWKIAAGSLPISTDVRKTKTDTFTNVKCLPPKQPKSKCAFCAKMHLAKISATDVK